MSNGAGKEKRKAILDQKYIVARELRQLAAIQYGRDSEQFKKADVRCSVALAKAQQS